MEIPVTPFGVIPKFRERIERIRAIVPPAFYETEAKRVDVKDESGESLALTYWGKCSIAGVIGELWLFRKDTDTKAYLTIYKDESTGEFIYQVARNTWEQLNVYFDGALIGTAPTFPAVTTELTPSVGYVFFKATPIE
jgi:hypothetical protein